uniref:Contryphan Zo747/Zo763 n=1 Tax=Conus zonatus TaxID=754466 RepID=COW_CONZO|nr:RecName: Full=Contryphan Zo747/Zo763 [Conus zonatus]
SPCPFPC